MAKYAQNTTTGHTCPWGSADDNLPSDSFTLAAQKAAAKRRESQDSNSSSVVLAHTPACLAAAGVGNTARRTEKEETESKAQSTSRSVQSGGYGPGATARSARSTTSLKAKEAELEKKMMDMISHCLDKKVLELRQSAPPKACTDDAASSVQTSRTTETALSSARSGSQIETAREQTSRSKAKGIEKGGYDALERYPALLKEMKSVSAAKKAAPEGLTSNGKQKQAMKLSDASLGKFDADESRLAYLEMQKSAAEARNKNRSALSFGDDTSASAPAAPAHKDVTMFEKRDKAKRLSDASLGKFDADQSQIAYLDMQNTAAAMRNKNRVGQGIF